jgi:hypothetical protein
VSLAEGSGLVHVLARPCMARVSWNGGADVSPSPSCLAGCGKSTQCPQYICEAFPDARVVITQPTRLAAIGAAKRVAVEMKTELGDGVGFRIGGEGISSRDTRVTFATSGWLLTLLVSALTVMLQGPRTLPDMTRRCRVARRPTLTGTPPRPSLTSSSTKSTTGRSTRTCCKPSIALMSQTGAALMCLVLRAGAWS